MRIIVPLLLLFSATLGCAKPVDIDPIATSPEQTQALVLSSLDTAAQVAPAWTDFFADAEQAAGCVAFAAVGLAAPVLQDSLVQVYAHTLVTELPAVQGSAASCGLPTVELFDSAEIEKYSALAWGNFYGALQGFGPQLQALNCEAYTITMAAGEYAHALAPALIQVPATWSISIPAVPVDYTSCEA